MEMRVISLACVFGLSICFLHSVGIHQGIVSLQKSVNLLPSGLYQKCTLYSRLFCFHSDARGSKLYFIISNVAPLSIQ
jgi:hypothetical protein